MKHLLQLLYDVLTDQQGSVLVEYSLALSLLSLVAFSSMIALSLQIAKLYSTDTQGMQSLSTTYYLQLP